MKTNAWFPLLMTLVLSFQSAPSNVMAEADLKLAQRQLTLSEAVFHLNEQAKKEELVVLKNLFLNSQRSFKPSPIEPVLGNEIQPDRID